MKRFLTNLCFRKKVSMIPKSVTEALQAVSDADDAQTAAATNKQATADALTSAQSSDTAATATLTDTKATLTAKKTALDAAVEAAWPALPS